MAITGWALDDGGIAEVRIFRDPVASEPAGRVFVGHAVRVRGARPDVESLYPSYPGADRAGWGLLMLTNMLPAGGNGTYVLHAEASDVGGQATTLGSGIHPLAWSVTDNLGRTEGLGSRFFWVAN